MKRWLRLPKLNSRLYYVLLAIFAIVVLGPLGAIVGAFMLFSLGFSVGGQVIAGILGSAVTFGYGSEGKHGANYMQTAAASVASVGSLAVLIQARAWLGLPEINTWVFMTYVCCIGMFGIGVGMLYTGLVVDKMKLTFPSGLAVANILRALTDKDLLKQSIAKLGSGTGVGFLLGLASNKLGSLQSTGLSVATIGVGMIVGARIAVPGLLMAVIGEEMLLWLQYTNYIEPGDPFRKIGFIVALGMIIGAAVVDMISIGAEAVR
ncbi:MAG: peptide transporter, partial [Candidatus Gracilibacteria bacterium]